jgi:hypothetical protein
MEQVSIKNPELIEILDKYKNIVIPQKDTIKLVGEPDQNELHTSPEYLDEMIAKGDEFIGFPEASYGQDLIDRNASPFYSDCWDIRQELGELLVSPTCAVMMYYPENGFMSWHNNWNCPGYNILLSWSETGNGFFRYKNPTNGNITTMYDSPGWTAKVGYFGEKLEPESIVWHCARTYEPRLTLGYVIPDKNMWEMMIDDISAQ